MNNLVYNIKSIVVYKGISCILSTYEYFFDNAEIICLKFYLLGLYNTSILNILTKVELQYCAQETNFTTTNTTTLSINMKVLWPIILKAWHNWTEILKCNWTYIFLLMYPTIWNVFYAWIIHFLYVREDVLTRGKINWYFVQRIRGDCNMY